MLIASFHSRALKQHQKPNTYLIEVVELYQALITMPVELSPSSVRGCDCWYGHGCELELPADSKLKFVRGVLSLAWLQLASLRTLGQTNERHRGTTSTPSAVASDSALYLCGFGLSLPRPELPKL